MSYSLFAYNQNVYIWFHYLWDIKVKFSIVFVSPVYEILESFSFFSKCLFIAQSNQHYWPKRFTFNSVAIRILSAALQCPRHTHTFGRCSMDYIPSNYLITTGLNFDYPKQLPIFTPGLRENMLKAYGMQHTGSVRVEPTTLWSWSACPNQEANLLPKLDLIFGTLVVQCWT